jgi:hypothetical protein
MKKRESILMTVGKRLALGGAYRASIASLAAVLVLAAPAKADEVVGRGTASITKDTATTQSIAQSAAKREIVRAMLNKTIGHSRQQEVSAEIIDQMAAQIRADMLISQQSERVDTDFVIHLTADIDQAWFRTMLSDFGIDSSSQRANANRQKILVYLDQKDGTATDLTAPALVEVEYDRRTGGSYSDTSSITSSSKEASAASSRNSSASASRASGAQRSSASGAWKGSSSTSVGASGSQGSVAGLTRSSGAGAVSGRDANAYSSRASSASASKSSSAQTASSSFADRANVQAEVHDDVRYRFRTVYQQPPRSSDGDAIRAGLNGSLLDYDVQVADAWMALSSYYTGGVPRYEEMKNDPSFGQFLQSLNAQDTPFFLGGAFEVTQSGRDPASGQFLCSGKLDAGAAASSDGRVIGSGIFSATALGASPENCSGNVTVKLSNAAADKLGPQIQRYWRSQARASEGHDSRVAAGYSLILRGANLDMNMQQDLLQAIESTPGAEIDKFISANSTEMRLTVIYAGATPLQFALFKELRGKPAFAGMQTQAEGRSIDLCLSSCVAGM